MGDASYVIRSLRRIGKVRGRDLATEQKKPNQRQVHVVQEAAICLEN